MEGSSSSPPVRVVERTDRYVVATWRRLMLLVWRGQATTSGVERSRSLFDEWAAHEARGAAFLVVVPGQRTRPPDDETRTAMRQAASSPSANLKGMATLLEAEGFVAASVRAVMMRLSSQSAPSVFRTTAEAAAWAGALLEDPELTPAGLADAIRLAREGG